MTIQVTQQEKHTLISWLHEVKTLGLMFVRRISERMENRYTCTTQARSMSSIRDVNERKLNS